MALAEGEVHRARVCESAGGLWHERFSALALRRGDVRALATQGFTAQPPRAAKPLMAGRVRVPSEWTDTDCKAVSSGAVIQLCRAGEELSGTRANQLLRRMSELQREFAPE